MLIINPAYPPSLWEVSLLEHINVNMFLIDPLRRITIATNSMLGIGIAVGDLLLTSYPLAKSCLCSVEHSADVEEFLGGTSN